MLLKILNTLENRFKNDILFCSNYLILKIPFFIWNTSVYLWNLYRHVSLEGEEELLHQFCSVPSSRHCSSITKKWFICLSLLWIRDAFQKKNCPQGDIGTFSFTPPLPSLNGTREIGTWKIVH